ncbi:MAG: serine hydroxymethyltransferase [Parcubacteria group bacterium]|nr:serine hydroxymethyltransferase [Parcubacteria group bacterium]
MDYKNLKKNHSKLYKLLVVEKKRQKNVINLIPSENYVSQAVLEALGTEFTNKYAEGYSEMRYYFGNKNVDQLEDYAKLLVYKVFKIKPVDYGVNLQAYSGSTANLAVYHALLNPGDKVLSMSLEHGGHLTHGHKVSLTGKLFNFIHYGVNRNGFLDYDQILQIAQKEKPKMIVCGASAYSRIIDFKKFKEIADSVGAYLMADISHIAGLIAGGAHPSPFPYADIATTTTHKTLRGPRAALIISKKQKSKFQVSGSILHELIDKMIFPGMQGGPHMNTIFAIAVCLEEALKPNFKKYAKQVVKNAKALANELQKLGFKIISDGTDNHLMLIDVTPLGHTGKTAGEILEKNGIIVNKNMIPYDTRKPWDPLGIRIGTPTVTTQGMTEKDMEKIAKKIHSLLTND